MSSTVSEHSVNPEIKQFNIRLLSENGDARVKLNNCYLMALRNVPAVQSDEADSLLLME